MLPTPGMTGGRGRMGPTCRNNRQVGPFLLAR
uniref:Uncharacterized protein n=1 Tax=Siphoviridae sp. ctvok7 TaxID=2827596 RepID=A0A8S5LLQ8_9CAUD|nr:MAG TPA: hypothetical protein [Siphoviridae sp. ctvok7]